MPKVILEIESKEFDVLHCNYSLNQNTDFRTGKPVAEVVGGTINLEVDLTGESSKTFFQMMVNPHDKKSGSIKFFKPDEDAVMMELQFQDAVTTGYSASADARSNSAPAQNVVLSSKKITIDGVSHENKW